MSDRDWFYRLIVYVSGMASVSLIVIGIVAGVRGVWLLAAPTILVGVAGFEYSYRGLRRVTPPRD